MCMPHGIEVFCGFRAITNVNVWIALGIGLGPVLPDLPHLGLVGTALFVGLLVPRLTSRPAIVAARSRYRDVSDGMRYTRSRECSDISQTGA